MCSAPVDETILGIKLQWIISITICLLLIFVACGFSIGICLCRRKMTENISEKTATASAHLNHQSEVNGSKHLNSYRPAVSGEIL
jgi:hypothetical protein